MEYGILRQRQGENDTLPRFWLAHGSMEGVYASNINQLLKHEGLGRIPRFEEKNSWRQVKVAAGIE